MDNDALSAGTGSLISSSEIKVLICYVLDTVGAPLPGTALATVFNARQIANYFEVLEALDAMKTGGTLIYHPEDETYEVTERGAKAAETLKNSLPFTIRQKATAAAFNLLSRRRHMKDTRIETVRENGKQYIVCSALENNEEVMSIKLMVTDDMQASCIKERFLTDPSSIYETLVSVMTDPPAAPGENGTV